MRLISFINCYLFILFIYSIAFVHLTSLPQVGYGTRTIIKQSKAGLDLEFSFLNCCLTVVKKKPSLPHYLPVAGKRRDGFMPFLRALVQSETQTALTLGH